MAQLQIKHFLNNNNNNNNNNKDFVIWTAHGLEIIWCINKE